MATTQPSVTLQVSIARPLSETYAFLSVPESFPRWASGLGSGLTRKGDRWFTAAPEGTLEVRFSPQNAYGVADHWVVLPDGGEVYVPLRVIANGTGSEVLLTFFRRAGVTDQEAARDRAWIQRDLRTLKELLERG